MTPNHRAKSRSRRMLTRSMSARTTNGVKSDANICFEGTDTEEFGKYPPRFLVQAKMQYREGIDRRVGMTGNKVGIRLKKGDTRVPHARVNCMKNLFDQLLLGDQSESEESTEGECDYCTRMKKFLYGQDQSEPTDGICTCFEADNNKIASVVKLPTPRTPVLEPLVTPEYAPTQDFTNVEGPMSCSIVNPYTDLKWVAKGRGAKVAVGAPPGMYCWALAGSMSRKQVYVFGYQDGKSWKYATVSPRGNRIVYKANDVNPASINVENGGELRDMRAFCLKTDPLSSGDGAHIVPAFDEEVAIVFDENKRLKTSAKDPSSHKWKIDIS